MELIEKLDLELSNKNILVTGASRGIGLAIAKSFLIENARVCIVSRGSEELLENEKKLKKEFGDESVWASTCDCTETNSLEKLKEKIIEKWGSLDVVIANVGNGKSDKEEIPNEESWDKIWNINFQSALFTARAFLPMLKESKGSMLFISSITGLEAFGAPTDYSVAKTSVISFAKNLARKSAPNVRVNVIAPGNIYFENGEWDKKIKANKEIVYKMINSKVPMNRFGTPKEIGDASVFLSSDRARFITGATLVIDGGQTVRII